MAKKAELLEKAKELKLNVSAKNTIAEIEGAIKAAEQNVISTGVEKSSSSDKKDLSADARDDSTEKPIAKASSSDVALAKSGKRSAKALAEAEEKQAKTEHQHNRDEEATEAPAKPKKAIKPTRSRLERRGKKYQDVHKQIEKGKTYSLNEALGLAAKTNPSKFDASVEMHVRLNVDPRQADQNIRSTVVLPAGTGKAVRVAVFSDDKVADADVSGTEAVTKLLDKENLDFDVLISPPANMAKLGKYARLLGPRGLMPNPKSGTVTADLAKAVKEAKAGRVEYRVDSTGIIHTAIGKVSFEQAKLSDNANALLASIRSNKPSSVKGTFLKSVFVTTSMGPSIPVVIE